MVMYKSVLASAFTLALLFSPTTTVCHSSQEAQGDKNVTEVQLTDERSDVSNVDRSLLDIHVSLLLEQRQTDISRGLRTITVFQNRGSEVVSVRGLHDSTSIEIVTKDGWPVKIPREAPD